MAIIDTRADKPNGPWISYQRFIDDAPLFITAMLDLEPHFEITRAPLIVFSIAFKSCNEEGLPTAEEFRRLIALDTEFDTIEDTSALLIIGRITKRGTRAFYVLAPSADNALAPFLLAAHEKGYKTNVIHMADGTAAYLSDLVPTVDEKALSDDLDVLSGLLSNGDDAEAARSVAHFSYFPEQSRAEEFAHWAQECGFSEININTAENDGGFLVKFQHLGTMLPDDILGITTGIREGARDFGGHYDGWETQVIAKNI